MSPKGSAPLHYTLDQLGAMVVTADRGKDPDKHRWHKDRVVALERSQHLRHLVGTDGFFCALGREARHRSDAQLVRWWPEARCEEFCGHMRPDGYGVWREGNSMVEFFLEYDRGTETGSRLRDKLIGYYQVLRGLERPVTVLFCFRTARREANARRALAETPVPVATAAPAPNKTPNGPIWLPIGYETIRLRLVDLANLETPECPEWAKPPPNPGRFTAGTVLELVPLSKFTRRL